MNVIQQLEKEQQKEKVPALRAGDTVKVHAKVVEGTRERIQVFEGTVIRVTGGGLRQNFTVRRVTHGVGVERTFLVHSPRVEKIEVPAEPLRHPVCLAGERACPPEDCGGPPGYMQLVEILRDPDHEEYEEHRVWSGGSFDPEAFNLAAANRKLRQLR